MLRLLCVSTNIDPFVGRGDSLPLPRTPPEAARRSPKQPSLSPVGERPRSTTQVRFDSSTFTTFGLMVILSITATFTFKLSKRFLVRFSRVRSSGTPTSQQHLQSPTVRKCSKSYQGCTGLERRECVSDYCNASNLRCRYSYDR